MGKQVRLVFGSTRVINNQSVGRSTSHHLPLDRTSTTWGTRARILSPPRAGSSSPSSTPTASTPLGCTTERSTRPKPRRSSRGQCRVCSVSCLVTCSLSGAIGHQPANQSINQSIDPNHAGERSGRRRPWTSTSGSSATSGRRHGKVNNRIANARLELTEQTHISHFIQEMDRPRPRGGQEARRRRGGGGGGPELRGSPAGPDAGLEGGGRVAPGWDGGTAGGRV